MLLPGTLQDIGDPLDVAVGPRRVRGTDGSRGGGDDDEETDGEDGLFVGNLWIRSRVRCEYVVGIVQIEGKGR